MPERIIEWGFDQYVEKISDISQAATKELAIEVGLAELTATWEQLELDMRPHKDKGHFKVHSTEEIFQTRKDHQMKLSTMKASRFVKAVEA